MEGSLTQREAIALIKEKTGASRVILEWFDHGSHWAILAKFDGRRVAARFGSNLDAAVADFMRKIESKDGH